MFSDSILCKISIRILSLIYQISDVTLTYHVQFYAEMQLFLIYGLFAITQFGNQNCCLKQQKISNLQQTTIHNVAL